jgi:ATP-binding cassette subfamily B protein
MMVGAVAEVVTLGAVLPFIAVLVEPEQVFVNRFGSAMVRIFGISDSDHLMTSLTALFVSAAAVSALIRIAVLRATAVLAAGVGTELGLEMYRRTLHQPYRVHVARHSSEVMSGLVNKVDTVSFGVFLPLLGLLSSSVVMVSVTGALIAVDPTIALATLAGFGLAYVAIARLVQKRLRGLSEVIAENQTSIIRTIAEGLGGIRDILLDGTQSLYLDWYEEQDRQWRRARADTIFIRGTPRHLMEALGIGLVAFIALWLRRGDDLVSALPVLGVIVLGGQRLLPALQQAYGTWTAIAGNTASLSESVELLDQPMDPGAETFVPAPSGLRDSIKFGSVSFRYEELGPLVIENFDLTIPAGNRIGIAGPTGSGKSTVLDLLMGLLEPTTGKLTVDGQEISGASLKSWQRSVAHVPQSIYLSDSSFAANIAFGIVPEQIDMERVIQASEQAELASFIEETTNGYRTNIGEHGVRLSGGQRQRIGIARALYKGASVLVLDEATSALDKVTEAAIMESIERLDRNITVLMVTHRLSTMKHFDMIVELIGGRITAVGSYDELLSSSPSFGDLASGSR